MARQISADHKEKLRIGREKAAEKERKKREQITHTVMSNRNNPITIEKYTRTLAIKLFCVSCLGHETHPSKCESTKCPLFPFRKSTLRAYEPDPNKASFLDTETPDIGEEEEEDDNA